ncbi:Ras-related protein Rab-18 [Entamoeba marina]
MIGDEQTGKRNILSMFTKKQFDEKWDWRRSWGDMGSNDFVKLEIDRKMYTVFIMECSGCERGYQFRRNYLSFAHIIQIVYDVTNRKTFENIEYWIGEIKKCSRREHLVMIVANKIDLKNRQVTTEEGKQFSEQNGFIYTETSAKCNIQITECFNDAIINFIEKIGI